MRGNELLDKMNLIEANLIEAAEAPPQRRKQAWFKWGAIAACLCLLIAAITVLPLSRPAPIANQPGIQNDSRQPQPQQPDSSGTAPTAEYTLYFNEISSAVSAARIVLDGVFWRELTADEVAGLFPIMPEAFAVSARADFHKDGSLYNIAATCTRTATGELVQILLQPDKVEDDMIFEYAEEITSNVYGVSVTAARWESNGATTYFSNFELDGVGYRISARDNDSGGTGAELVSHLTGVVIGGTQNTEKELLSVFDIKPGEVPELINKRLNESEARADADFGAYLPKEAPEGFTSESITRFKDQQFDNLSALWCRDMDQLAWKIRYYSEQDRERVTAVADTENYDLGLYPIPRSESVPDELREIVNDPIFRIEELTPEAVLMRAYSLAESGDTKGYRMQFSVLIEDNIIVEISSKGVSPQWVYEQLMLLK